MSRAILFGMFLICSGLTASGQEAQVHDHGPVQLDRVGKVDFSISCRDSVQPRFNTAVAMLHSFWYEESERLLLVSNHKTTALGLDAIMRESPQHPLVTKLARGLLDGRKRGRWISTQENVVVLQTMRRYFDIFEKDTPNYTGKLWFGNAAYAEEKFVGRSGKRGVSQLVSVTRDRSGAVIDGSPDKVTTVTDVWTFARDVASRDPNWKLVATEAGQ